MNRARPFHAKPITRGAIAALTALLLATAVFAQPDMGGHGNGIVDKARMLEGASFLDNRDADWYAENIPFLDTPDKVIDDTWYYRFDMMTKHIVYGSPQHGYSVTEFIDRPHWSGTYGAISCPLGLQFSDLRWLRDQRVTRDFARYWMHVPGAQPRTYSNWFGASMWGLYQAWGDKAFIRSMLPDMKAQYAGWEAEHWDKRYGMFVWDGMHDGMETNINSRQTAQWFDGAPGVRPTLNSYMFADARAIAATARLAGDAATADRFEAKAAALKKGVQDMLWDKERQFFFHMFANDEKLADGRSGAIKAGTLTYRSGLHAGDNHGRELIGFVPWQFNLPDPGYEAAWKGLGDPQVFEAKFGPVSAERHDPLFRISERCCEWSGNSWPYATAQTLEALANLLNDYQQDVVGPADYYKLLRTYSLTQRKDGVPFIAEAADPDTGAWQIQPGHSEHYFHSSYIDLVVTGLAGLRPRDDDRLVVNPLIPKDWNWFALDDIPYHSHLVSIVWDRDGSHYGRGKGLRLIVDGSTIGSSPTIGRLEAMLPAGTATAAASDAVNYAVNNGGGFYPSIRASYSNPSTPPQVLQDGAYWYLKAPGNRWTSEGAPPGPVNVTVDFGIARPIDQLKLYFLDDGAGAAIRAPAAYRIEVWTQQGWRAAPLAGTAPIARGHRTTTLRFAQSQITRKLRLVLDPQEGAAVGMTEVEAWGTPGSVRGVMPAPANLAYNRTGQGFPKASASSASPAGGLGVLNDGRVAFNRDADNRWVADKAAHGVDWVTIDLGRTRRVARIEAYYWSGVEGVLAPRSARPQYWSGRAWKDFDATVVNPAAPRGSAMQTFRVVPTVTSKVRLLMDRNGNSPIALTELMAWED